MKLDSSDWIGRLQEHQILLSISIPGLVVSKLTELQSPRRFHLLKPAASLISSSKTLFLGTMAERAPMVEEALMVVLDLMVLGSMVQQLSFLIPYDTSGLQPGDVPQIEVDFQLVIDANLEVTNATEFGGGFTADFDADFSNTATLTNVTVLDDSQVPIAGASVVDSFTGQGLVAVPEPSTAIMLIMAGCVGAAHRRRRTV